MDLRDLQYEVGEWHKGHFPDATTTNIVLKLVEEVGELAKAHNENLAEGTGDRRVKVMDAIGDVTIVLAALCAKIGLSYGLVVQHVWAEVQTRSDERVQRKGDE